MKCFLSRFLFLGLFLTTLSLVAEDLSAPKIADKSKTVRFDKKKYDEMVKKILREKGPSFLGKAADRIFKECFYVGVSGAAGFAAFAQDKPASKKWGDGLIVGVLVHTTMRLLFDYLLVSKDPNLQNLDDFEKYVKQTFAKDDSMTKRDIDLVLRLFEKDYDLILNKIDQDKGAGIITRFIKFMAKHSMFIAESAFFGFGFATLTLGKGANFDGGVLESIISGSCSGMAYFVLLMILFDGMLSSGDQRQLKIEKLRDIVDFFEDIRIKKLEVQHEAVAEAEGII